ncbi:MAG: hypothetical protein OEU32_11485, partial [Acidimicrobiia bacterium]|nr:hypothetical protein [Acidimicrobiia bacterium]
MSSPHRARSRRIASLIAAMAVMMVLLITVPVSAQDDGAPTDDVTTDDVTTDDVVTQPDVIRGAETFGPFTPTSGDVSISDLAAGDGWSPGDPIIDLPRQNYRGDLAPPAAPANPTTWSVDPLLELQASASRNAERALATPDLNFGGQGFSGVNPPDTVGDVGTTYYTQMINGAGGSEIAVYDKATGVAQVTGFVLDNLWPNAIDACSSGKGDPIVLYDHLADRWLLSEFANAGNFLCVYVSVTGDVLTSTWNTYQFATPNFPDYPKYGVWPDAYYVSTNESGGPAVYALDRAQMLAGAAATMQ